MINKRINSVKISTKKEFKSIVDEFLSNFKHMTLKKQTLIFVIMVMFLFILTILYLKFLLVDAELQNHIRIDVNIKKVRETIDKINLKKSKYDVFNINNNMVDYTKNLNLLKILYIEMADKMDLLDSFKKNDANELDNGASRLLGQIPDMNFEILNKFNEEKKKVINRNLNNSNSRFMYFFYEISPLMFQFLFSQGTKLNSFFYITFDDECSEENTFYFKYPIQLLDISRYLTNFDINDSITDPITQCSLIKNLKNVINNNKQEEDLIKNNNWFYNVYNQFILQKKQNISNNLTKFIKVGLNLYREEFLYNYSIFKHNKKYIVFIGKFDYIDRLFPTIKDFSETVNNPRDFNSEEFFTFVNNEYGHNLTPIKKNIDDNIYWAEYNIDDSKHQLFYVPKFIESLFKYTFFPQYFNPKTNEVDDDKKLNNKIINVNTLLLDHEILKNPENKILQINKYFTTDTFYYYIATFLNNLSIFKKYDPVLNLSEDDRSRMSISELLEIYDKYEEAKGVKKRSNDPSSPCFISDLGEYYDKVKNIVNCENEICNFLDCKSSPELEVFINKISEFEIGSCYCLPMYCYDDKTKNVPEFFNKIKNIVMNDRENQINNNREPYSFRNINTNCNIQFYKKHNIHTPFYFNSNVFNYEMSYFRSFSTNIYLNSNIDVQKVVDNTRNIFNQIILYISIFYIVVILIILVYFVKDILERLDQLIKRIDSASNIHRKILDNSSLENYSVETEDNLSSDRKEHLESLKHANMSIDKNISKKEVDDKENLLKKSKLQQEQAIERMNARFFDEIEELINIINDNIKDFNMEFDVNKSIYHDNIIVIHYRNFLRKKIYTSSIIPTKKDIFGIKRNKKQVKNDYIKEESREYSQSDEDDRNSNNEDNSSSADDENDCLSNVDDEYTNKVNLNLSSSLLCEILSVEYIDLSSYIKNFFFRYNSQPSMFNFYDYINTFLINDEAYINEITDYDKVSTSLKYINNEITKKWMEVYIQDKEMDEL